MSTALNNTVSSDAESIEIESYSNSARAANGNHANNGNNYSYPTKGDHTVTVKPMRESLTGDDAVEDADARRDRLLQIYLPGHGRLRWLVVKSLVWIFPLEIFLYMLPVFINYGVCPDMYTNTANPDNRGGAIFIFAFFHFFSFLAIISSTFVLVFELGHHVIKPGHLVSMYFAICIHYASWYQLVYACNQESIAMPTSDVSTDLANRMIVFVYLSVAVMTTAGLGDTFPVMWWGKTIAMTQMVLALLYTTGIFGIGLDHFRVVMQRAERESSNPSSLSSQSHLPFNKFLVDLKLKHPLIDKMRIAAIRYILPLTVVIQLVLLGLLVAAYGHGGHIFGDGDESTAAAGAGVVNFLCLLFQFFQFCIVVVASLQIIRAINAKDMSLAFLIQSYIALMTLFGGIYLTIYLFVGETGFQFNDQGFDHNDQSIFKTFGELLWMSFVVMSTTGFGDVAPVHTAARIFVFLEMIMSVFYGIVVLGIAMARTMHSWQESRIALPALPDEMPEHEHEHEVNPANIVQAADGTLVVEEEKI